MDHWRSGHTISHRLSTARPLSAVAAGEAISNQTDPAVSLGKSKDHRSNRDPSSIDHTVGFYPFHNHVDRFLLGTGNATVQSACFDR